MDREVLAQSIVSQYEDVMRAGVFSPFDRIGFLNVGYWKGIANSLEMAQLNLLETLLGFFANTQGTVLDVGCGKGATAKYLTKYFQPGSITGINISEPQLKTCRIIAPNCNFRLMNATNLEFADSSLDNILCIEAAQHFLTRQKFFEEAYRVLKVDGRLAMLDTLFDYEFLERESDSTFPKDIYPRENELPDLPTYRARLLEVGFRYVRIEDCTELTGNAACEHVVKELEREFGRTKDVRILERIASIQKLYRKVCKAWALIHAIK